MNDDDQPREERQVPDQEQLLERVHALETAGAGQAAALAGAQATQAAAQAGTWATMFAGSAGLIVGMFLGMAITKARA
jgi:hypothetical protein